MVNSTIRHGILVVVLINDDQLLPCPFRENVLATHVKSCKSLEDDLTNSGYSATIADDCISEHSVDARGAGRTF